MTTRPFSRPRRLLLLIERINQIHCKRRLTGRPTAHLYPRCRAITAAYLAERDDEILAGI
jgi:hypothetical protein